MDNGHADVKGCSCRVKLFLTRGLGFKDGGMALVRL